MDYYIFTWHISRGETFHKEFLKFRETSSLLPEAVDPTALTKPTAQRVAHLERALQQREATPPTCQPT